ncbi:MAG: hypothetical protein WC647_16960 [Desulfomonilaceae bacterium]
MFIDLIKSLTILFALVGLLSCAAVETPRREIDQSAPKVKEEDITGRNSGVQPYQAPQDSTTGGAPGIGQPMNSVPPYSTDSGSGKTPRRFLWKDRN